MEGKKGWTLNETDSVLHYSFRDSTIKPLDEYFYFNPAKICYKDAEYYNCDSCLKRTIAHILANEKQQWVKISDNKYISRRRYVLDITSNSPDFYYVVKKEKFKKKEYKKLVSIK